MPTKINTTIHIKRKWVPVYSMRLMLLAISLAIPVCLLSACNATSADPSNIYIAPIKISDALEKAIHSAVLKQLWDDPFGETDTEGHCVLLTENEKDGTTVVYAIASYASFGFENDVFTIKSGCGAIPAVIRFSESNGVYTLLSYKEPADGDNNENSIKELFPRKLWTSVVGANHYYAKLTDQQMQQAEAYLKSIGRDANVSAEYVEKEDFHISVEASNTLFGLPELYDYPLWIGTQEFIEGGKRYVYEAREEDFSGYTVLTFTKRVAAGGAIKQQVKYKVTGDSVKRIDN